MQTTRQRLTLKLLLLLIVPPVVCTFGMAMLSSNHRSTELLAEADRELADHVMILRTTLPRLTAQLEPAPLSELIEQLVQRERVHGIALYDRSCKPLARSEDLNRLAPAIDALVCDGNKARPEQHRAVMLGTSEVLVRTEPISIHSDVGMVAVTHELSAVKRIIEEGEQRLLLNGALIALCMAGVALLIARSLGGALGTLVQAAERVAAGDLKVRVSPPNLLELGRLGLAFNQMTEGLVVAQRELLSGESRRRELERRLRHAQALRAIGQVAASFAHEIASPLSTILGWARLAATEPSLTPEFREQTGVVSAQCERITRIVQRLLNVSRFPPENRVQVMLREVALEAAAFLQPECNARGIKLRTECEDASILVYAERDSCLQIFINLCMNAIHAQPRGGALTLSLLKVERRAKAHQGSWARLEVRDAGPGVPSERRAAIFEPFHSMREGGGGLGLGLAIVRDIVKELDGEIELDDAKEGGACFRIYLPMSTAQLPDDRSAAVSSGA